MRIALATLALTTEMTTRATLFSDNPEIVSGNLTQTTDILPETEAPQPEQGLAAVTPDPGNITYILPKT